MSWRGRASEVINLVDFEKNRLDYVVPNEFEIRLIKQMGDVGLLAGEEVIQANHIVPSFDKPLAQMRP